LTIGNLMLSKARLNALLAGGAQGNELADLSRRIDEFRQQWRVNWGIKAAREYGSRINLWQQYLHELRGDAHRNAAVYPSEVRQRAILHLLLAEVNDIPTGQKEQLNMLDQILRGLSQPGPFVWEPELASGFPKEDFWFLYVTFAGQGR